MDSKIHSEKRDDESWVFFHPRTNKPSPNCKIPRRIPWEWGLPAAVIILHPWLVSVTKHPENMRLFDELSHACLTTNTIVGDITTIVADYGLLTPVITHVNVASTLV